MLRFPCRAMLPVLAAIAAADDRLCRQPPRRPSLEPQGRVTVEPRIADEAVGGAIADVAMGMVGTRYLYGGTDPLEGFDCSGLVYYAYGQAGYQRAAHVARAVPGGAQDLGRRSRSRRSHVLPGPDEAVARRHLLGRRALRARARERPERRGRQPRLARTIESTSSRSAGCCRTDRLSTASAVEQPRARRSRRALARGHAACARRAAPDAEPALVARAPSRAR